MKKVWIFLLVIFLFITVVNGDTKPYETASLGRIVGDTPEELIEKLEGETYNINDVERIANKIGYLRRIEGIDTVKVETDQELEDALDDNYEDTLLYLDTDGGVDSEGFYFELTEEGIIKFTKHKLYSEDVPKISDSNILFANTPLSALYLSEDQTTTIIGSTSEFISERFPEHLLCNLEDGTIGESYQTARNEYYKDEQAYIQREVVGLNLMSYHLLGNPNSEIEIGNDVNLCGKDQFVFSKAPTILKVYPDGRQTIEFKETSEGISTKTLRFPLKTVILDVSRTRTMNPKEVSEEESCMQEYEEGLTPNIQFTLDQEILTVISNPYDCEKNVAYTDTQYEISFISKQPFTAIIVNLPGIVDPGEEINFALVINSVRPIRFEGDIVLELDGEEIEMRSESLDTPTNVGFTFDTPEEHGYHKLKITLIEDGEVLTTSTNVFFVDNPPEEKSFVSLKEGREIRLVPWFYGYIPIEISEAEEIIHASFEIEVPEKEKFEPFVIDKNLNVVVGDSVFERVGGIYTHKYKEKMLYPQHPGRDYHIQNDGVDVLHHERGDCSVKVDTEDKKVINCVSGGGGVEYTFVSTDQNSVLLKFFFEGEDSRDMLMISQTHSWPMIKVDDPESYSEEQTIEEGETGAVIFRRGGKDDPVRIAYIFNPEDIGGGVVSSYGAALQAFSNQGLGNGQVNLNDLRSGLRIVGYFEDEFSVEDIKNWGNDVESPIRIMIGEQEMIVEEGGRVDFTEALANYIEDNSVGEKIHIVLGSEVEQNVTIKDLEIIYS